MAVQIEKPSVTHAAHTPIKDALASVVTTDWTKALSELISAIVSLPSDKAFKRRELETKRGSEKGACLKHEMAKCRNGEMTKWRNNKKLNC